MRFLLSFLQLLAACIVIACIYCWSWLGGTSWLFPISVWVFVFGISWYARRLTPRT